jgi:dTDP-glucose pyrophosphorylase
MVLKGAAKDWRAALIPPSTPILEAIKVIDRIHIALVVDANSHLIGTVTDGDVRRGALGGSRLQEKVETIMARHPLSVTRLEGRTKALLIMEEKKIRHVPVLDSVGRVIGLEALEELGDVFVRENIVVLMAGGLGSRLRPLTDDCPKPLLSVGKKPILETIIENFVACGFRKFYVSVNYKNEMVRDYFGNGSQWSADISYLHEKKRLGTAGALALLPEKPKKPFFVMNGDLLTKVNFNQLLHFHSENKAFVTMCVREYDFQIPYGVVALNGHRVRDIDEKPIQRFFVNAGIYVLDPQALKLVKKDILFDMPHFFKAMIKQKKEVHAFPIREYWLDIGRMDDLERANSEFPAVFS